MGIVRTMVSLTRERDDAVLAIGTTNARGRPQAFGVRAEDRFRHLYLVGKTGMGKSTLLENLAIQDIRRGAGVTFIDPHGNSAERLLAFIPRERVRDVVYFAPFDLAYPIAFNVLERVDADKRHLVVSSLMATFEKIWVDAWSARMAYILQHTIAALLEYPGATLLGVNRMYIDREFRKHVIEHVTDPVVRAFWKEEFARYTDRYAAEATPAIQNKVGQFASNAMIRNIIGQPHTSFDLRRIMDERRILIVNLSKGRVGEDNARLLGAMLITKLYLAAMSRAEHREEERVSLPPHYLYVDEFQSFANRTFADILSEARKYKLSLTIAHQYLEQIEDEIRAAVFGNVGTLIAFRVGAYDAEVLEREFGPTVTRHDLVNLGFAEIYVRLMVKGVATPAFTGHTLPPYPTPVPSWRDMVLAASRAQFARDRAVVEEEVRRWHQPVVSEATALKQERRQLRKALEGRGAPSPVPPSREAVSRAVSTAASRPHESPSPPAAPSPSPSTHSRPSSEAGEVKNAAPSSRYTLSPKARTSLREALNMALGTSPSQEAGSVQHHMSPSPVEESRAAQAQHDAHISATGAAAGSRPSQRENSVSATATDHPTRPIAAVPHQRRDNLDRSDGRRTPVGIDPAQLQELLAIDDDHDLSR